MDPSQLRDRRDPRPVLKSERVFTGAVWNVRRDTVDLGDAGVVSRDLVEHPGAGAVLPYREVDGVPQVLLIQQYRHPIGTYEWEIPAGLLDVPGEDAALAARRELAEEVDLEAGQLQVLIDYVTSPGGLNEAIRVYLARELTATTSRYERTGEEAEMPTGWFDLEAVIAAIMRGEIGNSVLVVAVLAAQTALAQQWEPLRECDAPWPARPKPLRD